MRPLGLQFLDQLSLGEIRPRPCGETLVAEGGPDLAVIVGRRAQVLVWVKPPAALGATAPAGVIDRRMDQRIGTAKTQALFNDPSGHA